LKAGHPHFRLGSDQGAGIIAGLHASSAIAVALLVIAAFLALAGIRSRPHP